MNAFSQLDPRIVRLLQWVILAFSVLSAAALWLVRFTFVSSEFTSDQTYYMPALYAASIGLVLLGFLQWAWKPMTEKKSAFYLVGFHALAILAFMFVVGYDTIFIFIWLMLIMATDAFLGRRAALASMSSFGVSMVGWWYLNADDISNATTSLTLLLILAAFICAIALVVSHIRVLSGERGQALEEEREKARLSGERLGALINSMGDAVIAVNEVGKVSVYNAAASSLLDTNVNLVGKPITEVLHLITVGDKEVDLSKLLAELKGNVVRTDLSHVFPDEEKINLYINVSPIHLGFQKVGERGYILVLRDITKEKSLEQERDEFISVVSHELRTPVAIAEGGLSNVMVLKERHADQKLIDDATKTAYDQVVLLSKMINDLATLSRAERGVGLEIETVDPQTLLDKLKNDYTAEAQKKGLELIAQAKTPMEPVETSLLYVQEILQNFITNALKYTKEGSVTVTAETDAQHRAVFSVKDTGIGISKSDQKHLYEKFWRSEDYRTRESSGTGLGLYLVKKLAQRLGATITFESQLNEGSTFTLTVPSYQKSEEMAPVGVQPALTNNSVNPAQQATEAAAPETPKSSDSAA